MACMPRWSRSKFIAFGLPVAANCNSYFTKAKNVSLAAHKAFYLEKPKLTLMLTLPHNSSVSPVALPHRGAYNLSLAWSLYTEKHGQQTVSQIALNTKRNYS